MDGGKIKIKDVCKTENVGKGYKQFIHNKHKYFHFITYAYTINTFS